MLPQMIFICTLEKLLDETDHTALDEEDEAQLELQLALER